MDTTDLFDPNSENRGVNIIRRLIASSIQNEPFVRPGGKVDDFSDLSDVERKEAVKELMDWGRQEHERAQRRKALANKIAGGVKFILILDPDNAMYLDWYATEHRMHKAQVIRSLLEGSRAEDKEYKNFVNAV